jgi:mRNA-degrading endonuclease toxin of MazEF toxin-antitoxin module
MIINKHEIWMVELGNNAVGHEQKGNRPFYVISNNEYNKNSKTPIGFFLSTSEKKAQNRFTVDVG